MGHNPFFLGVHIKTYIRSVRGWAAFSVAIDKSLRLGVQRGERSQGLIQLKQLRQRTCRKCFLGRRDSCNQMTVARIPGLVIDMPAYGCVYDICFVLNVPCLISSIFVVTH